MLSNPQVPRELLPSFVFTQGDTRIGLQVSQVEDLHPQCPGAVMRVCPHPLQCSGPCVSSQVAQPQSRLDTCLAHLLETAGNLAPPSPVPMATLPATRLWSPGSGVVREGSPRSGGPCPAQICLLIPAQPTGSWGQQPGPEGCRQGGVHVLSLHPALPEERSTITSISQVGKLRSREGKPLAPGLPHQEVSEWV